MSLSVSCIRMTANTTAANVRYENISETVLTISGGSLSNIGRIISINRHPEITGVTLDPPKGKRIPGITMTENTVADLSEGNQGVIRLKPKQLPPEMKPDTRSNKYQREY